MDCFNLAAVAAARIFLKQRYANKRNCILNKKEGMDIC